LVADLGTIRPWKYLQCTNDTNLIYKTPSVSVSGKPGMNESHRPFVHHRDQEVMTVEVGLTEHFAFKELACHGLKSPTTLRLAIPDLRNRSQVVVAKRSD
tara:strand:- start:42 stop:341 length:300 start_codon:yes stop_codon:yes gene_type:complete